MNTRKGRKQVLTTVSDQDQENDASNNNKNNILRAFLETWLNTKQDLRKSNLTEEQTYEEISQRLIDQGYAVSSRLVKKKICSFVKKYQYVKKCEREGKKIEWCNYDIVKQIFDLDAVSGLVIIPRQNIKAEDELDCEDHVMDDNKNANDDDEEEESDSAQTQTFQPTVKEERVELIEIPDEDTYTQKNKQSERDEDDDSDASEDLDEDLDFDNPLDSIPLRLPNGTTVELERRTSSMEPPPKRPKVDTTTTPMPQLRTVPTIQKPGTTLTTQPRTIPGLKKDEFLIPTVNNVTGQQQFLVVKRLDQQQGANTSAASQPKLSTPPLLKTVPSVIPPLVSPCVTPSTTPPLQIKLIATPPQMASPTLATGKASPTPKPQPSTVQPPQRKNKYLGQGPSDTSYGTLFAKIVELQEQIVAQQEYQKEMDRLRMEREHEFQQEMITVFKEIKDKLCDKS